jgi:hypothetical protein
MMKGYYMTFGIFSNELEKIVCDLETTLKISLEKEEENLGYDNDIYYLISAKDGFITCFDIIKTNEIYHIDDLKTVNHNFLISCNVTSEKDEDIKEKYIDNLRKLLSQKDYLMELNIDIDEW